MVTTLVVALTNSDAEQNGGWLGAGPADDRTLVTLLHLRDIEEWLGDPYSIVSEMNDDSNREVAQVTKADDFIVSTKMISLLLTQLTENQHLNAVFADLFDPEGSEIYLKPASNYLVPEPRPISPRSSRRHAGKERRPSATAWPAMATSHPRTGLPTRPRQLRWS